MDPRSYSNIVLAADNTDPVFTDKSGGPLTASLSKRRKSLSLVIFLPVEDASKFLNHHLRHLYGEEIFSILNNVLKPEKVLLALDDLELFGPHVESDQSIVHLLCKWVSKEKHFRSDVLR